MGLSGISVAGAISAVCALLSVIGCVCLLLEVRAVRRFGAVTVGEPAPNPSSAARPGVTLLKPLHGDEPGLTDNLRSFLRQDHAGPLQIVFGVADPADPAAAVVRRLQAEHPGADIALVVSGPAAGVGNAKVANLAAMSAAIRHPLLILSDSDIRVGPDHVRRTVACLAQPGVGLVTCLYRGDNAGGLWGLLAAMAIDYQFLPSVLLGVSLGRARPCMGATMAFTRTTLEAIGGFAAFLPFLADDHAIGDAVWRSGQRVVVAPHLVVHRCLESSGRQMLQHELRWARTIRGIDPAGFAGSLVTYPVSWALAAGALRGFDGWGLGVLAAACVCRLVLQSQVDRTVAARDSTRRVISASSRGDSAGRGDTGRATAGVIARWALMPVRDVLSAAVFVCSFFTKAVVWRGRRFRIDPDGRMAEI